MAGSETYDFDLGDHGDGNESDNDMVATCRTTAAFQKTGLEISTEQLISKASVSGRGMAGNKAVNCRQTDAVTVSPRAGDACPGVRANGLA